MIYFKRARMLAKMARFFPWRIISFEFMCVNFVGVANISNYCYIVSAVFNFTVCVSQTRKRVIISPDSKDLWLHYERT